MAEEVKEMSDSEKKKEDWMNSKWRPAMGWMYMLTCMTDFVLFPILWSLLQAVMKVPQITQWQPLTLQGAGLFHIAMGAVLGIAAMGRTQEKLAGANNGGAGSTTPSGGSSGFSLPTPTGGFGGGGFNAPAPAPTPAPSSFGGSGFGGVPSQSGFGSPMATTASGKKIVPMDPDPVL
jgi:hypothetical protein